MTLTCKSQLLYRIFKCDIPYSADRILTRLRPGRSVVRTWAGTRVFFSSENKTDSGARSLPNSDVGYFAGVRRPGRQAYHLPASLFSLNCADDRQCIETEVEGLVTVPILRCDDTTCDCRYWAVTTQPPYTLVISLY
jgi:hypothetical protein